MAWSLRLWASSHFGRNTDCVLPQLDNQNCEFHVVKHEHMCEFITPMLSYSGCLKFRAPTVCANKCICGLYKPIERVAFLLKSEIIIRHNDHRYWISFLFLPKSFCYRQEFIIPHFPIVWPKVGLNCLYMKFVWLAFLSSIR